MKPCVLVVASLALLAGCAGQRVKLSEDHRKTLTTETVYAVHLAQHEGFMPESRGRTTAALLFSPLLIAGYAFEGAEMVSRLQVQDPVVRVKERLVAVLQQQYKFTVKMVDRPVVRLTPDSDYKALGTGVVLEVGTARWGFANNRAKYSATARVIRLSDGVILWEARCRDQLAGRSKPSPSDEAFQADGGALLKAGLVEAADACADQLAAWAIEKVESR